jgi:hypothetical protein
MRTLTNVVLVEIRISGPCRRPGCAGGSCPRSATRGPP